MINKEIENTGLLSFKNKTKEAIKKSKIIINKHKNDNCDCNEEASLAYDMQYVERYIEQLEAKAKELEKENQKLTYARDWYFEHTISKIATPEMLHKILITKYISRNKIEDRIAELWIKCPKSSINEFMINERNNKIEVLQELLEEK